MECVGSESASKSDQSGCSVNELNEANGKWGLQWLWATVIVKKG